MINKFKKHLNKYKIIINSLEQEEKKILKFKKILLAINKKQKILVFGNGGSAAIANHFAIDVTNVINKKCFSLSDNSIITCLSNDYGFENWVDKAIKLYSNKNDILILISSSGISKNMTNAIKKNKKNLHKIITFTGKCNSELATLSDINFQVNSKTYNIIENIHQIILLTAIDLIKEKKIN
jgi:D-sedoheptulose 7-phosphate isomerase